MRCRLQEVKDSQSVAAMEGTKKKEEVEAADVEFFGRHGGFAQLCADHASLADLTILLLCTSLQV